MYRSKHHLKNNLTKQEQFSIMCNNVSVAQLDRAFGYEPKGQEFESSQGRQFNNKRK